MAEATRTQDREVTESVSVRHVSDLQPGDTVAKRSGEFQATVDRIITTPGKVVLELTEDEAQFLADIMARIGGDMTKSRRRFQTEISNALGHVGIPFESHNDLRGGITALGGDFHPLPG